MSTTDICSQALLRIGQQPIGDISEQSNEAIVCRKFYEQTVNELLRQHPWNFAIENRNLSASATTSTNSAYEYSYPLPADCLRVLSVYEYDYPWCIEGKNLLISSDDPEIKYIKRVTDSGIFPDDFIEALVLKLAGKICIPLTKDKSQQKLLYEEYEMTLGRAKAADAQENSYQELSTSTIINARY